MRQQVSPFGATPSKRFDGQTLRRDVQQVNGVGLIRDT